MCSGAGYSHTLQSPGRCPGFALGASIFNTRQNGFSLVELIAVLIIAGILAAVVLPRLSGETGFEGRGFRDEVATGLRYAQKSAIAARRTTCAAFSTAPAQVDFRISSNYGATDCTTGSPLAGPDGLTLAVKATGAAGFSSAPGSVIFDAAGRPTAATTISFSGLSASLDVTVAAETGYVH